MPRIGSINRLRRYRVVALRADMDGCYGAHGERQFVGSEPFDIPSSGHGHVLASLAPGCRGDQSDQQAHLAENTRKDAGLTIDLRSNLASAQPPGNDGIDTW